MKPGSDLLGDRIKQFEAVETERKFDKDLPIYARIDGRSFSAFTRDMDRPFDARMTMAMIGTTMHLVEKTNALIGYCQSDEISLAWLCSKPESQPLFGGKVHKLTSVLASLTTAAFTREVLCAFPNGALLNARLPHFDARVFQLPSKEETANAFLWRTNDARKNAVSQVARAHFSAKQLHEKNSLEMIDMLMEKGVNFYDVAFKSAHGTFVRRRLVTRCLWPDERERIPEKHRPPVDQMVTRHTVEAMGLGEFRRVKNRVEVIFDGAEPIS